MLVYSVQTYVISRHSVVHCKKTAAVILLFQNRWRKRIVGQLANPRALGKCPRKWCMSEFYFAKSAVRHLCTFFSLNFSEGFRVDFSHMDSCTHTAMHALFLTAISEGQLLLLARDFPKVIGENSVIFGFCGINVPKTLG